MDEDDVLDSLKLCYGFMSIGSTPMKDGTQHGDILPDCPVHLHQLITPFLSTNWSVLDRTNGDLEGLATVNDYHYLSIHQKLAL